MIPGVIEVARRFGFTPAVSGLALTAALAGIGFFVQAIARWFGDRNP